MTAPSIDPQFQIYLTEKPSLSYVQAEDPVLRRIVIDRLERLLGRRKIEEIYHRLKADQFDVKLFFEAALNASNVTVNHLGFNPKNIKVDGPLVILANHPFGILDGLVLCDIAVKIRADLRIMINAVLCQDADLAAYFLPVDFDEGRQAMKTNIRSKQLALQSLANNIPVLIFPSGMVSTAGRFGLGRVYDGPWTTFAAKLVREAKATVLPVYFHGQNSRKFHIASHIAEPLRMGMLMHEALIKFNGEVAVTIGRPLEWSHLACHADRRALTTALYDQVQGLASGIPPQN